jgi:replicative DNA helicase
MATRVPPHNLGAEESLLGAMLLSREAIADAVEITRAEDFYKPAHGHVFEAVKSLYGAGEPADPVTVAEELRRAGLLDQVGGVPRLVELQAQTPSIGNARRYARIVDENALLRRLIGVAGDIAEMGYDMPDDVVKALDRAESMVFEVAQRRNSDTTKALHELLGDALDRLEKIYDQGESITGVPTGFTDLDDLTSGLQPSALIVVGARPSMGKTAFALGIASHVAVEASGRCCSSAWRWARSSSPSDCWLRGAGRLQDRMRKGKLTEQDWTKIVHAIGRLAEARSTSTTTPTSRSWRSGPRPAG